MLLVVVVLLLLLFLICSSRVYIFKYIVIRCCNCYYSFSLSFTLDLYTYEFYLHIYASNQLYLIDIFFSKYVRFLSKHQSHVHCIRVVCVPVAYLSLCVSEQRTNLHRNSIVLCVLHISQDLRRLKTTTRGSPPEAPCLPRTQRRCRLCQQRGGGGRDTAGDGGEEEDLKQKGKGEHNSRKKVHKAFPSELEDFLYNSCVQTCTILVQKCLIRVMCTGGTHGTHNTGEGLPGAGDKKTAWTALALEWIRLVRGLVRDETPAWERDGSLITARGRNDLQMLNTWTSLGARRTNETHTRGVKGETVHEGAVSFLS